MESPVFVAMMSLCMCLCDVSRDADKRKNQIYWGVVQDTFMLIECVFLEGKVKSGTDGNVLSSCETFLGCC